MSGSRSRRRSAPGRVAAEVGQDLAGAVRARPPGDPTSGVGSGPAEVEPLEGNPVPGVAEERPPGEEPVQALLPMHRVAPGEGQVVLEVRRGERATPFHEAGEARRGGVESLDDRPQESVAGAGAVSVFGRSGGDPLHDGAEAVLAGPWGPRRIRDAWDRRLDEGTLGELPVLPGV